MVPEWIATFGAGDIEADDPLPTETDGELGNVLGVVPLAHTTQDEAGDDPRVLLTLPQAAQHRAHHPVPIQALTAMQGGSEAQLRVYDTISGEIDDRFVGHPVQRLFALHHPNRVFEGLQVAFQRSAVPLVEPVGQGICLRGGQAAVAGCHGELQHRVDP